MTYSNFDIRVSTLCEIPADRVARLRQIEQRVRDARKSKKSRPKRMKK